jgi:hypothetical protein
MGNGAIMNIEKGEEIAMMCVSQAIPNHGYYKFLAKKKVDNTYQWAHFIERFDKRKEKVYRGDVDSADRLLTVLEIMNRNLVKIFGASAEMKSGDFDIYSAFGKMGRATD